jgi:predicted N-formylglutamate amidohydrolase
LPAREQPFTIENPGGAGRVLVVVDHASNRFPPRWGDLGLPPEERERHIAWDPGALPVAREMSRLLDAPLIAGTMSRLILDVNRPAESPSLAPKLSETTEIPGNVALSPVDRAERIAAIHIPYHDALDRLIAETAPLAVIAVHTFTPVYRGVPRPLHVGILFDRDERLGRGMIEALSREEELVVRANEPYSPADEVYYTLERHAVARGLLNAMIEIRNDEVARADDQRRWATRLAEAVRFGMGSRDRLS